MIIQNLEEVKYVTKTQNMSSFFLYILVVPGALWSEATIRRCFSKQVFLRISQFSQENTCVGASFFPLRPANLVKRDSNTGVFL